MASYRGCVVPAARVAVLSVHDLTVAVPLTVVIAATVSLKALAISASPWPASSRP